jgi:peroxiredoxin
MDEIQVGQVAPDFSLSASGGTIYSLSQYRGQKLVLYFYPRDNTHLPALMKLASLVQCMRKLGH